MTSYFQNNNWEASKIDSAVCRHSHGAIVGSAICKLSSIISALKKASSEELNPHFIELSPHGVVHTGHKHGNNDSVCTEYMASILES